MQDEERPVTMSKHPVQEGFSQLIKDICYILGDDWNDTPMIKVKERINKAIADALRITI